MSHAEESDARTAPEDVAASPAAGWRTEDWCAVWLGAAVLGAALAAAGLAQSAGWAANPLAGWIDAPGSWSSSPAEALRRGDASRLPGVAGALAAALALFTGGLA
ncbi:MAG TPA: hypothetical protein PKC18_15195, partial [Lacipirellulaceae bacterium]|nr:hypothetical protein [Lacipirellulaceae bacterium]